MNSRCIVQFTQSTQGDAEKIIRRPRRRPQHERWHRRPQDRGGVQGALPAETGRRSSGVHVVHRRRAGVRGVRRVRHRAGDGTNQLCITKDHDTVLINELAFQKAIDEAPPGMLIWPSIAPNAVARGDPGAAQEPEHAQGQEGRGAGRPNARGRRDEVGGGQRIGARLHHGIDRRAHHQRGRHHRGAGPARQLHREVEERRRSTRWSSAACSVAEAVRREDQGGDPDDRC